MSEPMSPAAQTRDRYLVKSLVHSSQLLSAFHSPGEALPLKEICARCGLPKTMAFRLLYTLEKCGMIDKVGQNLYQSRVRPWRQRLYRLGYAAQGTDSMRKGLEQCAAAFAAGFDSLNFAEHHYSTAQLSPDPITLTSLVIRLPWAWLGKIIPARPVMTKG